MRRITREIPDQPVESNASRGEKQPKEELTDAHGETEKGTEGKKKQPGTTDQEKIAKPRRELRAVEEKESQKPSWAIIHLPRDGRHTKRFLAKFPHFQRVEEVFCRARIRNPDQPEALVGLMGFMKEHVQVFTEELPEAQRAWEAFADTAIVPEWATLTQSERLLWHQLADYLETHQHDAVKLLGISYGGYNALQGMTILEKLKREADFAIPVKEVVVVNSPTGIDTIQSKMKRSPAWLLLQAEAAAESFLGKPKGGPLPIPKPFWPSRGDAVRIRTMRKGPFQPGEFPKELTVHYFATDPAGSKDPLVNQPQAIAELENAGVEVVTHFFKPDPKNAHLPAEEEWGRMFRKIQEVYSG